MAVISPVLFLLVWHNCCSLVVMSHSTLAPQHIGIIWNKVFTCFPCWQCPHTWTCKLLAQANADNASSQHVWNGYRWAATATPWMQELSQSHRNHPVELWNPCEKLAILDNVQDFSPNREMQPMAQLVKGAAKWKSLGTTWLRLKPGFKPPPSPLKAFNKFKGLPMTHSQLTHLTGPINLVEILRQHVWKRV